MGKTPDPADCAGAPGSIELGGELYAVPQATDADLMEVRRWLKRHVKGPLQMYADLLADPQFRKLPRRVRDEVAKDAAGLKMRGEVAFTPELALEMLQEPRHCAFLAWVLVRKLRPGLRYEDVAPLVNEGNATALFLELQRESGMDSLGNS